MTSQLAIDEINALWAAGLHPTVRDIVRLNALALRVEDARGRYVRDSSSLLPRVAVIGMTQPPPAPRRSIFKRIKDRFFQSPTPTQDSNSSPQPIFFRQPTLAHEEWLSRVTRWISHDYETILAVNCYALSRPADALCPADDLSCVREAVSAYAVSMGAYTRDQLYAAVSYAKFGADPLDDEPGPKAKPRANDSIIRDETSVNWDECVAVGVLHEGAAVLWGLSLAEMRQMTREQLQATIRRAYFFHGKLALSGGMEKQALGEFYAVLEEIRTRCQKAVARRAEKSAPSSAPSPAPSSAPSPAPSSAPSSAPSPAPSSDKSPATTSSPAPTPPSSGEALHADATSAQPQTADANL